mmetsp:Transcript_81683/g.229946  ORF Transcript_81683/g.229946 Transcript_81683/m.229946 type:complete len:318 (-) Transcript_81683:93-1046(-)
MIRRREMRGCRCGMGVPATPFLLVVATFSLGFFFARTRQLSGGASSSMSSSFLTRGSLLDSLFELLRKPGCMFRKFEPVAMLSDAALPNCFERCALVGSSAALKGRGLGGEIDSHDTVIRVNRIPTEHFVLDFGSRTDVLFSGPRADGKDMFDKRVVRYRTFGGQVENCSFGAERCGFTSMVFKGADFVEYNRTWNQVWPKSEPGWKPRTSTFALGYQSDLVNIFAFKLLNRSKPSRPSNGLHAFLTFGLMCKQMNLYGFAGQGTADGHRLDFNVHNLTREHELMRRVINGQARVSAEWEPLLQRLHDNRMRIKIME